MSTQIEEPVSEGKKTDEEKNELDTIVKTPREAAMAQMVDNAKDLREESKQQFIEDSGFDPDEGTQNQNVAPDRLEDEREEILDIPKKSEDDRIIEREGNQFIRLKHNGKEFEMPMDAAVIALQKAENTDYKTYEADLVKKRYEALIAQHEQTATLVDARPENVADTRELLNSALTKVYDGEVTDAVDILEKVMRPAAPAQPVDITYQVAEAVAKVTDHEKLKTSYDSFVRSDEFKDLASDKMLLERVNAFTEDLAADPEFLATDPSYDDYFNEAGKRTKDWLRKVSGVSGVEKPSQDLQSESNTRLERKRLSPTQPTQRTVRRGPKPDAQPHRKSREEILQTMAARRGQTNL